MNTQFSRFLKTAVVVAGTIATFLAVASPASATIYVTADDLNGSNLFGSLNPATGQFVQITTTEPLLLALTGGPGGQLIGADANSNSLFTITKSGVSSPFGSATTAEPAFGLTFAGGKFYADTLSPESVDFYSISSDGNAATFIKQLAGPDSGYFPTGNLAADASGKLFFNFSPDPNAGGGNSQLYTVDPATGDLTAIGNGLGSDILALVFDQGILYGLDANTTTGIGVFTIDTATGLATQISTVTGLPNDSYFIDAAASAVPEGGTTIVLLAIGLGLLSLVYHLPRRGLRLS